VRHFLPVRVLAVTTWFPTPVAPVVGVFVRKDVAALSAHHDVTVLHLAPPSAAASAPDTEDVDGVRVVRVAMDPRRLDHVLRAARAFRRWEKELRPDVVHSMAFSSLLPLALRRPDTPWVHTEHWSGLTAPDTVGPLWRLIAPLTRVLRLPGVVTAVCEYLARPIRDIRKDRPTLVVPCIVPLAEPLTPRREGASPLRLVAVGGLIDRKDPLTAVETVAELGRRGVVARLSWVGDGPLRRAVRDRARVAGVDDRVELVGSVPAEAVGTHVDEADVFLLPTRADNFCTAAAEALAHGRPVVVGHRGGQAEYVDDEVGALVYDQDAAAYADAVVAVRDRLEGVPAERIAARVGTRFSEDVVLSGYEQAYAAAQSA
jgi:L-malate glycosyltransferase